MCRRTFLPSGVLIVRTWEATNQSTGTKSRLSGCSMRTGTCPLSGPESQVSWLLETSIAMSAPELPAPTSKTPPGRSWDGLRYSLECICTICASSSAAKSGTDGFP